MNHLPDIGKYRGLRFRFILGLVFVFLFGRAAGLLFLNQNARRILFSVLYDR